jgi:hypothetical protein
VSLVQSLCDMRQSVALGDRELITSAAVCAGGVATCWPSVTNLPSGKYTKTISETIQISCWNHTIVGVMPENDNSLWNAL